MLSLSLVINETVQYKFITHPFKFNSARYKLLLLYQLLS